MEWYLPAAGWAAGEGITSGTAGGTLAAARPLTWQEAAVLLARTSKALGLDPEAVRTEPLPASLAEGAWDLEALEWAWRRGLLPEEAAGTSGATRAQGVGMAAALAAWMD